MSWDRAARPKANGCKIAAMTTADPGKLDKIVADARRGRGGTSAKLPRTGAKTLSVGLWAVRREFTRANLRELTVHHRDHNHENNPADGSNWELLCLYCHDNEHQRQLESNVAGTDTATVSRGATHSPFAALKSLLKDKQNQK